MSRGVCFCLFVCLPPPLQTGRPESGRWLAESPGSWQHEPAPPPVRVNKHQRRRNKQTSGVWSEQHGGALTRSRLERQAGLWACVCGETAWSSPGFGHHGRCDRQHPQSHDTFSRTVGAQRPGPGSGSRRRQVGGDLEERHRPSTEAPGPEPARYVPGPDPLLYDGQVHVLKQLKMSWV